MKTVLDDRDARHDRHLFQDHLGGQGDRRDRVMRVERLRPALLAQADCHDLAQAAFVGPARKAVCALTRLIGMTASAAAAWRSQ